MSRFTEMATTSHALSIQAMEEASRFGQRVADIDHLLLALVISEQPAGDVLRDLGITLKAARGAVEEQHRAQLDALGVTAEASVQGRIMFHETGGYEWSARSIDVITRANKRTNRGDAAAVLRQLVVEPSGMIENILRRLETSSAQVIEQLNRAQSDSPSTSQHTRAKGKLSADTEAFVPAPVKEVWKLLIDPLRRTEWEPSVGHVVIEGARAQPHVGQSWTAYARKIGPDSKPIRIRSEFQVQDVELLQCHDQTIIEWRSTFPRASKANARRLRIALEPAVGGTRLRLALTIERHASHARSPIRGLLLRPYFRFVIWMQLLNLSNGISRVFR